MSLLISMELTICGAKQALVVSMIGDVDSGSAGQVYETLIDCVSEGETSLIVDLSRATRVTRAGLRGLIVAAKLVQTSKGDFRICGASAEVADFIAAQGFNNLLKLAPCREAALEHMLAQASALPDTAPEALAHTGGASRMRTVCAVGPR